MITFFDLVDHEPDIGINAIYLAEFDKTTNRLKEKLTVKKLHICMFILKEFYDMAKKAYIEGNNTASYFITTRTLNLMDHICKDNSMFVLCHPVAMDILILNCQSIPIMKYPDFVLIRMKNVPALLSGQNQQAERLKLLAQAYEFKDIYSLAIQRGKEARELMETDEDKEEMTILIKRMEEKERRKRKNRHPAKKNPKPRITLKELTESADGDDGKVVLDADIEPVIKTAESEIASGQFNSTTAKQFHDNILSYLRTRDTKDHDNPLLARILFGLIIIKQNLSESSDVWFGIWRYLFHAISVIGTSCIRDESVTDKPKITLEPVLDKIFIEFFPKTLEDKLSKKDAPIMLEELMGIAELSVKNGNKNACLYITNITIRLHMLYMTKEEEGVAILPDLFLLQLQGVDIKMFPDYVIGVCETISSFPCCTSAQRAKRLEFEALALKEKHGYHEAIEKATLSIATFQNQNDKDRVSAYLHTLEEMMEKTSIGTAEQKNTHDSHVAELDPTAQLQSSL
ncbi:uncharacterized protein LOC126819160 isoform X2 [Patella vulgata]|nr:uncharacterized protein LOC126819160 isoform X2 [Patella vulgata]